MPFGQFVANASGVSKLKLLTVIHVMAFLFFLSYFGLFVALFVNVKSVNLWLAFVLWTTVGGVVVGVMQLLAYTMFTRQNSNLVMPSVARASSSGSEKVTYTGLPYVEKMAEGFIVSGLAWILGTVAQLSFLLAFKLNGPGKGCCSGTEENSPLETDPAEWFAFSNAYEITFVLVVQALATLSTTLFADFYPTRTYECTERKNT